MYYFTCACTFWNSHQLESAPLAGCSEETQCLNNRSRQLVSDCLLPLLEGWVHTSICGVQSLDIDHINHVSYRGSCCRQRSKVRKMIERSDYRAAHYRKNCICNHHFQRVTSLALEEKYMDSISILKLRITLLLYLKLGLISCLINSLSLSVVPVVRAHMLPKYYLNDFPLVCYRVSKRSVGASHATPTQQINQLHKRRGRSLGLT